MRRKLITISIPVYNEEANIAALLDRLDAFARSKPEYDFEFLFTDNASEDRTFEILAEAARTNLKIRVIRFSRNFGFQRSILTNYLEARGDAAVQIDADLQDPPELISKFLELWEQGYMVVYGIRRRRQENWFISWLRSRGYALIDKISEVPTPRDAGDFRLIDRCVIEHLRSYSDRAPYLRGIIASIGYPQTGVLYDRAARRAGLSKFGLADLVRLGIDGVCSQSTKPLFFITMFGIWTSIVSALLALGYLLYFLLSSQRSPAAFTTLILVVLISTGLNAAFLGLLGEYLGRIYNNVRSGPLTISDREVAAGIERRIEPIRPAADAGNPYSRDLSSQMPTGPQVSTSAALKSGPE